VSGKRKKGGYFLKASIYEREREREREVTPEVGIGH
jgi:hypothetical protein